MKLNVLERIKLQEILPAETNYVTYKIITNLRSMLSFSEAEIKEFQITEKDGMVSWKKSVDKEIEFGDKAKEIICAALKQLDDERKLNAHNVTLYEKFMI